MNNVKNNSINSNNIYLGIIGFLVVIIIGLLIYFLLIKKPESCPPIPPPPVCSTPPLECPSIPPPPQECPKQECPPCESIPNEIFGMPIKRGNIIIDSFDNIENSLKSHVHSLICHFIKMNISEINGHDVSCADIKKGLDDSFNRLVMLFDNGESPAIKFIKDNYLEKPIMAEISDLINKLRTKFCNNKNDEDMITREEIIALITEAETHFCHEVQVVKIPDNFSLIT